MDTKPFSESGGHPCAGTNAHKAECFVSSLPHPHGLEGLGAPRRLSENLPEAPEEEGWAASAPVAPSCPSPGLTQPSVPVAPVPSCPTDSVLRLCSSTKLFLKFKVTEFLDGEKSLTSAEPILEGARLS